MDSEKRTKKGLVGLLGLVLLLTLLSSVGYAQIPHKMNYQGYLTNAAGVPINGTVQMVFSIYNVSSGGTPLWTETHSVTVSQGVYSVILGEGSTPNPINLPFDTTYYLGVQVGADPEMTPRKILTSVGYAFRALTVESIGSHTHSGADITSGTVSEPRIDPLIARDSEVSSSISSSCSQCFGSPYEVYECGGSGSDQGCGWKWIGLWMPIFWMGRTRPITSRLPIKQGCCPFRREAQVRAHRTLLTFRAARQ